MISPIGWSITCAGHGPHRVQADVQHLVSAAINICRTHFPEDRGPHFEFDRSAEGTRVLRATIERGDFRAWVAIEHDLAPDRTVTRRAPAIRLSAQASSRRVEQAHIRGRRAITRARVLGWLGGLAAFFSLAWLMIGEHDPVFVLGGMLLLVALLLTMMAGGTLGGWVGEQLARLHRDRAGRGFEADVDLHDDIRRWKSMVRQLQAQRAGLRGRRQQPFRAAPGPELGVEPGPELDPCPPGLRGAGSRPLGPRDR